VRDPLIGSMSTSWRRNRALAHFLPELSSGKIVCFALVIPRWQRAIIGIGL
jgi:hypothetical protein